MKIFKVKGIVIKEMVYKETDKIITLMTDKFGKISCMAKGAKKNNSPLLASSQLFVYSDFLLYKGTSFYHINQAEMLESFNNVKSDYEKLEKAYDITKILYKIAVEDQNQEDLLSLYLNTLFVIGNLNKNFSFINSDFKLKSICILGYSPHIYKCNRCGEVLVNKERIISGYYDILNNNCECINCYNNEKEENIEKKGYIKISDSVLVAILYIISSPIKKVFGFELNEKDLKEFEDFVNSYLINIE